MSSSQSLTQPKTNDLHAYVLGIVSVAAFAMTLPAYCASVDTQARSD